jgi:hypothetical protein
MTNLVPSAARAVSGTLVLSQVPHLEMVSEAVFELNITAAAAAVGDTLDVYLQHSPDDGTTWDDFVHFTQALGNGGVKKFLATWSRIPTPEAELKAPADATLAAGVLQGPVGKDWRAKWVIGGATPGFTFQVDATLHRLRRR